MNDADLFDLFYKDARTGLLLQTYALTGDLSASRAAVREAFVVAWHHWRKVQRLDDPESSVRPHAWQYAQRRHTARIWHREKGVPPAAAATLEALSRLTVTQRKAMLLTSLAGLEVAPAARELGLPREEFERELSGALEELAGARGVLATGHGGADGLAPLRSVVEGVRWPRATIVRRAGSRRRRVHTTVGAAAAVAAVLVSGSLVTDAAGVRADLDRDAVPPASAPSSQAPPSREISLTAGELIGQEQLRTATGRRAWRTRSTSINDEGNGLVVPCQQERYADPRGVATWERTFRSAADRAPALDAVQTAELSRTEEAASRAFTTARDWYGACSEERSQLLGTTRVTGLGDQAMIFAVRSWNAPVSTSVIGVARTGALVTTTATRVETDAEPDLAAVQRLLSAAVSRLCGLPEGGACVGGAGLRPAAPLPVGPSPGLLTEIDLPPVSNVERPWVGTDPQQARTNPAATRCEQASFTGRYRGATWRDSATRTFLVPETRLPDEFGITETAGVLPARQAAAFVAEVRDRLAGCEERDDSLGTEVEQVAARDEGDTSLSAWNVTVQVSDERSVTFRMAILRRGTAVAQLTFVPAQDVSMPREAFLALADRALERLPQLGRGGA